MKERVNYLEILRKLSRSASYMMGFYMIRPTPLVVMIGLILANNVVIAAQPVVEQSSQSQQNVSSAQDVKQLSVINVIASADASADGLMPAFEGGQVATGGRVGIFGNQKNLEPISKLHVRLRLNPNKAKFPR